MSIDTEKLREFCLGLTKGEKMYIANKLYNHDRIVPQKIEKYIPDEFLTSPTLKYSEGEIVGLRMNIVHVDETDSTFPYLVEKIGDSDDKLWVGEHELGALKNDT